MGSFLHPKLEILILIPVQAQSAPASPPSPGPQSPNPVTVLFLRGKDLKSRNIEVASGREADRLLDLLVSSEARTMVAL